MRIAGVHTGETPATQCKVTYVQYLDAGGVIPTSVVESKIPLALGALGGLRDRFQRDDEIDEAVRSSLARIMERGPQTYSAEEHAMVNKVQVKLGMFEWKDFDELDSPDHLVKMGARFDEEEAGIVRASTVVDASVFECAAWDLLKTSRAQTKAKKNVVSSFTKINDHNSLCHFMREIKIPGFSPREFLTRVVWRKQEQGQGQSEKLTVVYESVSHVDFPICKGERPVRTSPCSLAVSLCSHMRVTPCSHTCVWPAFVQAESSTCWEFETLERTGQVHQTRAT